MMAHWRSSGQDVVGTCYSQQAVEASIVHSPCHDSQVGSRLVPVTAVTASPWAVLSACRSGRMLWQTLRLRPCLHVCYLLFPGAQAPAHQPNSSGPALHDRRGTDTRWALPGVLCGHVWARWAVSALPTGCTLPWWCSVAAGGGLVAFLSYVGCLRPLPAGRSVQVCTHDPCSVHAIPSNICCFGKAVSMP